MIQLARTHFGKKSDSARGGESTSKTPIEALDKALKYLENQY